MLEKKQNKMNKKLSLRHTDDKTRPHCECGYGSCICRSKYRKNKTEKNVQLEQERQEQSQTGRLLESLGG